MNYKKRNNLNKIPFFYSFLNYLLYNRLTRNIVLKMIEKIASMNLKPDKKNNFSSSSTRILYEKKIMVRAIINSLRKSLERNSIKKQVTGDVLTLWARAIALPREKNKEVKDFVSKRGCRPPFFLVISPGHECNLRCPDCYAASIRTGDENKGKLSWDILDKIIDDAKKLWGIKLIVFSGGEPFLYRSQKKGILDIAEKNKDLLFLVFTNGTLINENIAKKIGECKNTTLAFSVEGMQKATDSRRGEKVFNRVLNSMALMRKVGVPFGISVTVNRENCSQVLDDEFLDYFFINQGVFYGFYFQYLPIGRNPNFDLMPTVNQRLKFWDRMWQVIEDKRLFLIDFWNHGTMVKGCISAGRDGGYLHIDWDGNIMPCVFLPYIAGNIYEYYESGKNLTHVLDQPFLKAIREWQKQNGHGIKDPIPEGNLLTPCPYRDHYQDLSDLVKKYKPAYQFDYLAKERCENLNGKITGENGCPDLIDDKDYHNSFISYDEQLKKIFDPIWQKLYMGKKSS